MVEGAQIGREERGKEMVAKWLNATDCRSVLNKFVGSNPTHFKVGEPKAGRGKVVEEVVPKD